MMVLKFLSQVLLFSSFIFASLYFYNSMRKGDVKLSGKKARFLDYSLVSLGAGFLIGSETWLDALIYIAIIVAGYYAVKYFLKKEKVFEPKLLKSLLSFCCMVLGFLIMMQPENFIQSNAGNLTVISLFLLSLFVAGCAGCFVCYLFAYLRDIKKIKPRLKTLSGEVYLFYSSIFIAFTSLLFLMFTESIVAMFFIFLSSLLFISVFYIFALEREREIIYSKIELLFGICLFLMGILLSSSFALLLGIFWITYMLGKINFHEFREVFSKRLNLEGVNKKIVKYKGKIVNIASKVKIKRKK